MVHVVERGVCQAQGVHQPQAADSREGGNYAAAVEHEHYDTFMAMHTSPTQAEANRRVNHCWMAVPP